MALLNIIKYPDALLKKVSEPVTVFDQKLAKLVDDMFETMVAAKGIGLAAVQIAQLKRLIIIDIGDLDAEEKYIEGDEESERRLSEKKSVSKLEVFVNPKIISSEGEIEYEEGCLSVPGVYATVKRKEHLVLEYQDLQGKKHQLETHGLRSIVLQHEMDHMDGIVFPDRLGPMQKMMLLEKYKKLQLKKIKEPEKA